MRKIVKQATRANLWFFVLTWTAGLWGGIKLLFLWPSICWFNIKEIVFALLCVATILFVTAFFQARLKSVNRRQRVFWTVVAAQQRSMAVFLLFEAGVIAFITLINHAIAL